RKTIAEYCRKTVKTGYHPVGTAKMGAESDKMAVLTPDLKVKGIDGLRVCDASIMPVIVSANTNAPVQAIADHAADMIINDAKGQASS
ncbi:MAG: sorbosone dehydrogenase, partial [Rhodobacteraceae bacterium]|nr:sorbosone dehydrogenase [Paracoccaceae bacterium]